MLAVLSLKSGLSGSFSNLATWIHAVLKKSSEFHRTRTCLRTDMKILENYTMCWCELLSCLPTSKCSNIFKHGASEWQCACQRDPIAFTPHIPCPAMKSACFSSLLIATAEATKWPCRASAWSKSKCNHWNPAVRTLEPPLFPRANK